MVTLGYFISLSIHLMIIIRIYNSIKHVLTWIMKILLELYHVIYLKKINT